MMENIATPIEVKLIEQELTADKIVRATQNGSNIIYIITAQDSPNTMLEIGRLRELTFRMAGGGTGKAIDIDEDDYAVGGYKQLLVWDPEGRQIIGGYRYIVSDSVNPQHFSTEHYFHFSEQFRKDYLPYTIELGRSFIQPCYQGRAGGRKSIYALDNLWDGLGSLAIRNPHIRYFFGKVTMYDAYNANARIMLFYFLEKYFKDTEGLVTPIDARSYEVDMKNCESIVKMFTGSTYDEDYKILSSSLKIYGENIPPLINAYMKLSPSMKLFGTVVNEDFGAVHESGILVTIKDIYIDKYKRYIDSAKLAEEEMANGVEILHSPE